MFIIDIFFLLFINSQFEHHSTRAMISAMNILALQSIILIRNNNINYYNKNSNKQQTEKRKASFFFFLKFSNKQNVKSLLLIF